MPMSVNTGLRSNGELPGKEPFYFKSFDKVIGVAHNLDELRREFERLINDDPKALEYHLKEGHIVQWLEYIGEIELARRLVGVNDLKTAYEIMNNYLTKNKDIMTKEETPKNQSRSRRSKGSRKT